MKYCEEKHFHDNNKSKDDFAESIQRISSNMIYFFSKIALDTILNSHLRNVSIEHVCAVYTSLNLD